jgi:two-component system alkaline phosphatase synthesis response regulator PhoP
LATILLVDDDQLDLELQAFLLKREGHQLLLAHEPDSALRLLQTKVIDLVMVEPALKRHDGDRLCQMIQERHPYACLMIVSDRAGETDIASGLMTADDYVTKPISPTQFIARTKALLRRAQRPREAQLNDETLIAGDIALDVSRMQVLVSGIAVSLTPRELSLLRTLLYHTNRVLTRQQIVRLAWGGQFMGTPKAVDVCIQRLRKKLRPHLKGNDVIESVRGFGYRFDVARPSQTVAADGNKTAISINQDPARRVALAQAPSAIGELRFASSVPSSI